MVDLNKIHDDFIKDFNNKINIYEKEIENLAIKHKDSCSNSYQLFWEVRENLSDKCNEFISAHSFNAGISGLYGTKINSKLAVYINNAIVDLLKYPEIYAKTLYEE